MKQNARLILASQSKARAQILTGAGLEFETRPIDLNETAVRDGLMADNLPIPHIAEVLASRKATATAVTTSDRESDYYIIGADQILECGGEIFEKPGNISNARAQLSQLRGKKHFLHSAVCVVRHGRVSWSFVESIEMTMWNFGDDFLDRYVENANPDIVNCVGGYQLEGLGANLFDRVEGDYFSVLGLPLLALLAYLRKISVIE